MKEPVDKLIKDKLYDHESAVPDNLWERVALNLDHEEKKKPVYWHWAAVILLLIGTSVFMLREPSGVQLADNNIDTRETNTPTLVKEEQEVIEEMVPIKEEEILKRQLVAPMLTALDSRSFAVSGGEKMEFAQPMEYVWEEIIPEYKEEGRILVRIQLANHSADEVPKDNQKKSWRERIEDIKNADKKIRIPKPNISFADMFAAK